MMIEGGKSKTISLIETVYINGQVASMIENKFSYDDGLRTEMFSLVL